MSFSEQFVWGAAAAAYQIEGAVTDGGRGESIWDWYASKPGAIWENHNGAQACDHYNRYPEDVALMQKIGLNAYRFSIAWPRIFPDGTGKINADGLAFYDRLIDTLLAANITPYVTLFHWDLPLALHYRGGWLNPDSPDWFVNYVSVVVKHLGDRVKQWMTFNEPNIFISRGYGLGVHAPGEKQDIRELVRMSYYVMLAHGRATQVIRSLDSSAKIGFVPALYAVSPNTPSESDIAVAKKRQFAIEDLYLWDIAWWADPVYLGRFPADGLSKWGQYLPANWEHEMPVISARQDYFFVNIYGGYRVESNNGAAKAIPFHYGQPVTGVNWPVTPEAMYWGPLFLWERYQVPIIITENGMSNQDVISLDGQVHDPQRIDFLNRYLRELRRSVDDGARVEGYFLWSIMDNFEWEHGYKERFGIIYLEYETQRRILKDSAHWYATVIRSNGEQLSGN